MSSPTFIEVCAGAGGLSSGFLQAGFKPLLINELDRSCCATLRANHPDVRIEQCSMLDLDLTPFKGKVDVLQGGVPCQSFSTHGTRKGVEDPRGQLVLHFNKLINDCEPRMFLVENVKGLLSHNHGDTFRSIITLFANDGKYRVYHKVLNAKDYSVPQKRERVILVGVHTSIAQEWTYPPISPLSLVLRDVLRDVPASIGATYTPYKKEVMALVPPGGCWIDLPEDVKVAYMKGSIADLAGGKRGMARRLSMDEPCLTLTTSPCQKQTERCHPLETRPLTVREYARIQTFPDDYLFVGSMANQYKQIGNAVPVQMAYALAQHIATFLTRERE